MILVVSSFVLAALIAVGQLLLSKKLRIGWAVLLTGQIAWIPYDIITKQYGFLLIAAIAMPICVAGWRNFKSLDKQDTFDTILVVTTQQEEINA